VTSPIRPDRPVVTPLERNLGTPFVSPTGPSAVENGIEPPGPSFGDLFKRALNDTSSLQDDAKELIAAFLRGEPVELHQVMAASEEAAISLELLVEIRNKLTEAYRSVMSMQ
jgi:flagellar hook-basal body complex protein FliE